MDKVLENGVAGALSSRDTGVDQGLVNNLVERSLGSAQALHQLVASSSGGNEQLIGEFLRETWKGGATAANEFLNGSDAQREVYKGTAEYMSQVGDYLSATGLSERPGVAVAFKVVNPCDTYGPENAANAVSQHTDDETKGLDPIDVANGMEVLRVELVKLSEEAFALRKENDGARVDFASLPSVKQALSKDGKKA
jgi:hypothetical protein